METGDALEKLAALAQESRLGAYRLLVEAGPEGLAAGEIAEGLGVPPGTLSFHLKMLAHAGLVAATREGRSIRYRATFEAMDDLIQYLTAHCCGGEPERCLPKSKSSSRLRATAKAISRVGGTRKS